MTPWTAARQAPLSMGFSRREYWSRLPFPSPGDLPNLGIKPASPVFPALAGRFFIPEPRGKPWPQPLCAWVLSHFSRVLLFVTLWTVACQAPLSMGFSRQEYWNGLLQGIFPTQGSNLHLLCLLHCRRVFTTSATWEAQGLGLYCSLKSNCLE